MKTNTRILCLAIPALAVLMLSGCGKSETPAATAAAPAASKPASSQDATKAREIEITATDAMKFNLTEIRAKPGEKLAVTLTNMGTMPKFSMGHNWVLLAADVKVEAFANDASTAAKTDYVPASYKDRILASTKLLGPKQSDTVTFNAPKEPGRYPFLCTFPGHVQVGMKGELIVE
jgi:azurin